MISRDKLRRHFANLGAAPAEDSEVPQGGLSEENLTELIESCASAHNLTISEIVITRRLRRVAADFSKAVQRELRLWGRQHPKWLAIAQDGDDLFMDEGAYAVLLTLRADGMGDIADGRWETHFRKAEMRRALVSLKKMITERMRRWSDSKGAGVLEDAIREAAEESAIERRFDRAAPRDRTRPLDRARSQARARDDDDDDDDEDEDDDDEDEDEDQEENDDDDDDSDDDDDFLD